MIEQKIVSRYVNQDKLKNFLATHSDFAGKNCSIKSVTHEFITVIVPRNMTEKEIKDVSDMGEDSEPDGFHY